MDVTYFQTEGLTLSVRHRKEIRLEISNPMTGTAAATGLTVAQAVTLARALAYAGVDIVTEVDSDAG